MTQRNRMMLCGLVAALVHGLAAAATLQVQVEQVPLREKPSFLGKAVVTASYGDALTVVQENRDWVLVRDGQGRSGWVHTSALTEKRVVLRAGTTPAQTTADTREVALAGKGFNESVEKQFKAENAALDFTWIDRMETFQVGEEAKAAFLREGGLAP